MKPLLALAVLLLATSVTAQQPTTVPDLWTTLDKARVVSADKPNALVPVNGAVNVAGPVTLSCVALGADTFDVAFGLATPPPTVQAAGTNCRYTATVVAGKKYYWRVTANNLKGATVGDIVSFTTAAAPVTPVASANGTTVPPATQIVDATFGVWTISGSTYYLNGKTTNGAGPSGAARLIFWNGTVYVLGDDTPTAWYRWSGSGYLVFGAAPPNTTTPIGQLGLAWDPPPVPATCVPASAAACLPVVAVEVNWGSAPSSYTGQVVVPVQAGVPPSFTVANLVPGASVYVTLRSTNGSTFSTYTPELKATAAAPVTTALVDPPRAPLAVTP